MKNKKQPNKYELKKDRFAKVRGGPSGLLVIRCSECQHPVLLYQKDGPGHLLRMYLDKIHAPDDLANLKHVATSRSDLKELYCPNDRELLAVPMVYKPENRLALRIIRGSIHTEKSEGWFPPLEKVVASKSQ